jgi:hypothetical protein
MGATGTSHAKPANIRHLSKKDRELPAYITLDGQNMIVAVNGGWQLFQRVGKFDTRRSAAIFAGMVWNDEPIWMDPSDPDSEVA